MKRLIPNGYNKLFYMGLFISGASSQVLSIKGNALKLLLHIMLKWGRNRKTLFENDGER